LDDRKGIQPVKAGCWFVDGYYLTGTPVVTTTSTIFGSNKIQNGDTMVLAYRGSPGKWLLNKCRVIMS